MTLKPRFTVILVVEVEVVEEEEEDNSITQPKCKLQVEMSYKVVARHPCVLAPEVRPRRCLGD